MPSPPEVDPELLAAFRRTVRAKIERDLARERADAEALRAQIVPQVERAVAEARASGARGRVWLFGSFAWGQPGERSDVDLLIEGPDLDAIAWEVGRACGRMVHAVALDEAPATLRERVLAEGRPL